MDNLGRNVLKHDDEQMTDDLRYSPVPLRKLPKAMAAIWQSALSLARSRVPVDWAEHSEVWAVGADLENVSATDAVSVLCELLLALVSRERGVIVDHVFSRNEAENITAPTILALRRIFGDDIPLAMAPATYSALSLSQQTSTHTALERGIAQRDGFHFQFGDSFG